MRNANSKYGNVGKEKPKGDQTIMTPRRSRKMTHVCSLKVTRIESTFMHADLNLFLHCERDLSCLIYLLDELVDTL